MSVRVSIDTTTDAAHTLPSQFASRSAVERQRLGSMAPTVRYFRKCR
jgi:hypothetical protein